MRRSFRMRWAPLAGLLCLSIAMAGCVTTRGTFVNPTAPKCAPVSPDSVRIFTVEAELAAFECERAAIIEATGSGTYTTQTGMIEAMRKKAGQLGANAILLPAIQEPGAGAKVAAATFNADT